MNTPARSFGASLVLACVIGCGASGAPNASPSVTRGAPLAGATGAPAASGPEMVRRAPEPPRLLTSFLLGDGSADKMGHVHMEITAPSGATVYECSATLDGASTVLLPDQWPCGQAQGWAREPGIYKLRIGMNPRWKSNLPDIHHDLRVDGDEVTFAARVWLSSKPKPPRDPVLLKLTFDRIRPAPPTLTLTRAWTPAADGYPMYTLANGSTQELHGLGAWGNFQGHVEVLEGGKWKPYERGGMCATVPVGEPLAPRGTATAYEGAFIGQVRPFAPGLYRYVVQVALARSWGGAPSDSVEKGIATFEDRDVFELRDEIEIR